MYENYEPTLSWTCVMGCMSLDAGGSVWVCC